MAEKKIDIAEIDWDNDFEKELLKRSNEFAEGKVKTYTWEETKQAGINRAAAKQR